MVLVIVGDLALAYMRPHVPSPRESAIWIAVYVALALVFAGGLVFSRRRECVWPVRRRAG